MNRYCPECQEEKKMNTPSDRMSIESGLCPDCGEELEETPEEEEEE